MIRLIGVGVVAGACLTHQLVLLPPVINLYGSSLTVLIIAVFCATSRRQPLVAKLLIGLASCMLSTCWTVYLADQRVSDALELKHENVVTRLKFRIKTMPQLKDQMQMFQAELLEPMPHGIPKHIQVIWRGNIENETILPGQVWRAALVLRRPHGAINPHGFDYEGLMFQRNIRAIGQVRGQPKLIDDDKYHSFGIMVDRARHHIRAAMLVALKDARYGPVLIALAIGDQDGVRQQDWDVFNRTGITHLVSISGSHVTMIGAIGGVAALWLLKRISIRGHHLSNRIAAKPIAACLAVLIAFLYCLLAGWGVPARRTFLMLFVTAVVLVFRLPFSPSRVLCAAAAMITILDPWSPLSTGFWLSFMAVGVLFSVATRPAVTNQTGLTQWIEIIKDATRLQWIITLAMIPILAYLFQQISLSSIFANAIAIPVMTFIVTPLALMTALVATIQHVDFISQGAAWLGHETLFWMMVPINWMSQANWAMLEVAAFPFYLLILSLIGIAWAMQPPGLATRWAGWLLMLPAIAWHPSRPQSGDWTLHVFDVGQGAAALISTQHHHILYDTGKKSGDSDSALRVLLPAFRALGVKQIDWLVVSHSDQDHAGGLQSLLAHIPVKNLIYSKGDARKVFLCDEDMLWTLDEVQFQIFSTQSTESSNASSCVLKVQGQHHSILLPGDIGTKQESALIDKHNIQSDIVLMPHHGSKTSSSQAFIAKTKATHAIAQVGHLNRFRHPDQAVMLRWQRSGVQTWRSDHHGAIYFESTAKALNSQSLRNQYRRYWHH